MASEKVFDSHTSDDVTLPITEEKIFEPATSGDVTPTTHEQLIIPKQPVFWLQIFTLLLVATGVGVGTWAAMARFDKRVEATGKLELQGAVQEIKTPINGVVEEIRVRNGDEVQQNALLATLKSTAPPVDLGSLQKEKETLTKENQIYEEVLKGGNPASESKLASLMNLRAELVKENQYYQDLVKDKKVENGAAVELNADQQRLIAASSPELQSRLSAARMQIQELEKQQSQIREKLASAQKLLAVNQDILQQLTRVANEVAVPQQQYQRQRQDVLNTQAEIDRLNNEQQRIGGEITKAREELQNAIALSTKEVLSKIDNNQKRIADIDSQLKQAQQQNQQRIAEIDAELSKAQQPQYQQLKSPIDGVVFDVQPSGAGFATNTNQTLLTVVPNDGVVASVFFQDQEIGLIKEGMEVNVRVASSPQGEFGNLQGKVVWVGANVLPPSPERPYYAIPAKIQLQRPSLYMNGKSVRLQPGMQVYSQLVVPDQLTVWDVMRDKFGGVLPR